MPSKTFERRLKHCRNIEQSIGEASPDELREIQEKLNDEISASAGIFTFTFPLVSSTFFMILSFALAQFSLWNAVTSYLMLPSTMTMVLLVISSIVCALLYVIVLIVMSKGYMTAVHVHLWLARVTLLIAIVYVADSLISATNVSIAEVKLIAPLLCLSFIALSFSIIRSERFYSSLRFALYCRTLRKLAIP
jgi:hypothetical protein